MSTSQSTRRHGLWRRTAPPATISELAGQRYADMLVIGAGFAGLSCALHLAATGTDVAVSAP